MSSTIYLEGSGMLFAISYHVLPELREHYAQIMWAFHVRAFGTVVGLVVAYCLVRYHPMLSTARFAWPGSPIHRIRGVILTMLVGVIPGCLFWSIVELVGGGYWFWEACQAGAEREILLGTLGLGGWSFVLGHFLVTCFRSTGLATATKPAAADGKMERENLETSPPSPQEGSQ